MLIQFEIPEGSDELEELKEVASGEGVDLTESEYCQNIIIGYFANRVQNEYVNYATRQSTQTLKQKFGSLSEVKIKNKENK